MDYYDKLTACYIGELDATPAMLEQIEKIDIAWSLLHSGNSRYNVVRILCKRTGLQKTQAYKVLKDTVRLFGDVEMTTKKASKAIHAENFKRIGKKAEKKGDLKAAIAAFRHAARIEGAFDPEIMMLMDANAWLPAPVINYTTDPQVFINSQKVGEDTAFEEVPEKPKEDGNS